MLARVQGGPNVLIELHVQEDAARASEPVHFEARHPVADESRGLPLEQLLRARGHMLPPDFVRDRTNRRRLREVPMVDAVHRGEGHAAEIVRRREVAIPEGGKKGVQTGAGARRIAIGREPHRLSLAVAVLPA